MNKRWWHKSKTNTALFSFTTSAIITFALFGSIYTGAYLIWKEAVPMTKVDRPVKLTIPSIEVDANVQSVGLTPDGAIGIPTNFTDVAWYNDGPKPGELGNAIIDGHLDNAIDSDAVFSKLGDLKKGDSIYVTDDTGQKIYFRVTSAATYDTDNFPNEKIFGQTGNTAQLTLITCAGDWNPSTKSYNQILVVTTEHSID